MEMDPARRALYEYLFRNTACVPDLIREKYEQVDLNAMLERIRTGRQRDE